MPKPIAVFGATGGFGAAIARRLAANGHPLVLQGRNRERLDRLGADLSVASEDRLALDCTEEAAVAAAFADLAGRHETLSGVVVSLAAPFAGKLTHRQPWAAFEAQMDTQLKALHLIAVQAKPLLAAADGTSRMIVISSEVAIQTPPLKWAPYSAAKAAMTAYAQTIAQEWLRDGVRVHILAPGMAKTDLISDMPDEFLDQIAAGMPEKTLTRVQDVADMAAFCMTDAADTLYGAPIRVSRAAR